MSVKKAARLLREHNAARRGEYRGPAARGKMRGETRKKIRRAIRRKEFSIRLVRNALTVAAEYLEAVARSDRMVHQIVGKSFSYTGTKGDRISSHESAAKDLRYLAEAI